MGKIMLCVDAESARSPEMIGLDGIDLDAFAWLVVRSGAYEARSAVDEDESISEVWIVSSDEMSAVNLAAAIKGDHPACAVFVVMFEITGSAASRVRAAGVNGLLTRQGFARRFASARASHAGASPARGLGGGDGHLCPPSPASHRLEGAWRCGSDVSAAMPIRQGETAFALPDGRVSSSLPEVRVAGGSADGAPGDAPCGSAFVLSVVSGSGGAGKSSVAAMAAYASCARGLRTVLVDGDLQFGDLHLLMGCEEPLRIGDVLADLGKISELSSSRGEPALIAAPDKLESAEEVARGLPALFAALDRSFDVVVVNTGASWAEHHAVILESSSCALFVIDQRSSSVRACRHALDLCRRCGIATSSFVFAVNRCARGSLLTSLDVSCALQGAKVLELRDGGLAVEELLGAGLAGQLAGLRNDFVASVDALVGSLLPDRAQSVEAKEGLKDASTRPTRRLFGRRRSAERANLPSPSRGVGVVAGMRLSSDDEARALA